jgi:multiple sugar transport system permease protein
MAWVLFLIILVITLIQVRLSRRFVYYAGEGK